MKISYRILFINFAIVFLIIGSSVFTFYSIMYNVLSSQQSKYLSNSESNFIYVYQEILQNTEDDFLFLIKNNQNLSTKTLEIPDEYPGKNIDFIFSQDKLSKTFIKIYSKENIYFPQDQFSLENFLEKNPLAIVKNYKTKGDNEYYYGRIINENLLNEIAQKCGAEISVVYKGSPLEISNSSQNQKYTYVLSQAFKNLTSQANLKIYSQNSESTDILASIYIPAAGFEKNTPLKFLIFSTLNEAADLKNNLKYIFIVIGVCGCYTFFNINLSFYR